MVFGHSGLLIEFIIAYVMLLAMIGTQKGCGSAYASTNIVLHAGQGSYGSYQRIFKSLMIIQSINQVLLFPFVY